MKLYIKIISCLFTVIVLSAQTHCTKTASPTVDKHDDDKEDISTSEFIHPGIVCGLANLQHIASLDEGDSYEKLLDFIRENPVPYGYPSVVYVKASGSTPTETQIRNNASQAYAYALKWVKTGQSEDAQQAIKILNGWAKSFERYDVAEGTQMVQTQLEAAWVAPTYAAAAEIIRHHKVNGVGSGWPNRDIQQFSKFLVNLRDNYINLLIKDVDNGVNNRNNNWGTSAGYAKMAIGVFLDNKKDYEDGKRIIMKLLPIVIQSSGEVFELCSRDCHHPQYAMTGLTYAAEIAKIQGDDSIYEADSKRIKTGWEWIQRAFGAEIPCRSCVGEAVFPGAEVAANHYGSPSIEALAELGRPNIVTDDHTFLGFTTLSHYNVKQ